MTLTPDQLAIFQTLTAAGIPADKALSLATAAPATAAPVSRPTPAPAGAKRGAPAPAPAPVVAPNPQPQIVGLAFKLSDSSTVDVAVSRSALDVSDAGQLRYYVRAQPRIGDLAWNLTMTCYLSHKGKAPHAYLAEVQSCVPQGTRADLDGLQDGKHPRVKLA